MWSALALGIMAWALPDLADAADFPSRSSQIDWLLLLTATIPFKVGILHSITAPCAIQ